jgi:hypothetical protein
MRRVSFCGWQYRGFVIRRVGRSFRVERFAGEPTLGAEVFPRLYLARDHVDWLAAHPAQPLAGARPEPIRARD